MPTGYTHAIENGISFQDFVLRCSRAMGALVMMRDDSMDSPIPERFEPSDYHPKEIRRLEADLEVLNGMTAAECEKSAKADFDAESARIEDYILKARALEAKYRAMLKQVMEWSPPTGEHLGLKTFMVEQITSSIKFDCGTEYWEEHKPVKKSGPEWLRAKLVSIKKDLAYHRKQYDEEVERTESRNQWIAALRKSLEPVAA